jgi:uncharacterized protein
MKPLFTFILALLAYAAFATSQQTKPTETPIELKTETGTIKGTLLMPASGKAQQVVLIIAGSGPTDRNGNNPMMTNNHLKLAAEDLAKKGIATVRYDKRGIGESKAAAGSEKDIRFESFINDAAGWVTMLKQDKRFKKVVVLGHSEGSLIGMVGARQAKADAFISVNGAGQTADKIIRDQLKSQPEQITAQVNPILDSLIAGKTVANVNPMFAALFRPDIQPFLISWFAYNPVNELKKLDMPVLLVQGTTDIQVSVAEANLLAAANPKNKLVTIEKMNHILKEAPADQAQNVATYSNPDLKIVPQFSEEVSKFVLTVK